MRTRKSRARSNAIIGPEDVEAVFHQACIEHLATVAKLPLGADMRAFGDGIREAARAFAQDVRTPTNNALHDEIAALYRAAERGEYEVVASGLEGLSARGRELLTSRAERINRSNTHNPKRPRELPRITATGRGGQTLTRTATVPTNVATPAPADLRNETSRKEACDVMMRLCSFGGTFVEGRLRPSGKRSRPVWKTWLYAPEAQRAFPKRDAERKFVTLLRVAVMQAGGEEPAWTARHADDGRGLGPFAGFVRECLALVGAADVDVVELINELHQRRLAVESAEAERLGLEIAAEYMAQLSRIKP
jgi:hypothetical protein